MLNDNRLQATSYSNGVVYFNNNSSVTLGNVNAIPGLSAIIINGTGASGDQVSYFIPILDVPDRVTNSDFSAILAMISDVLNEIKKQMRQIAQASAQATAEDLYGQADKIRDAAKSTLIAGVLQSSVSLVMGVVSVGLSMKSYNAANSAQAQQAKITEVETHISVAEQRDIQMQMQPPGTANVQSEFARVQIHSTPGRPGSTQFIHNSDQQSLQPMRNKGVAIVCHEQITPAQESLRAQSYISAKKVELSTLQQTQRTSNELSQTLSMQTQAINTLGQAIGPLFAAYFTYEASGFQAEQTDLQAKQQLDDAAHKAALEMVSAFGDLSNKLIQISGAISSAETEANKAISAAA